MAKSIPFMSGQNFTLKFYLDGSLVLIEPGSIEVKKNVTEINEGVCGESGDRLQTIFNYWEINVTFKMITTEVLEALLKDTDNDAQNVQPLSKDLALIAKPLDGTTSGFQAGEMAIGGWGFNIGERKQLVNFTLPLRARTFEKI